MLQFLVLNEILGLNLNSNVKEEIIIIITELRVLWEALANG